MFCRLLGYSSDKKIILNNAFNMQISSIKIANTLIKSQNNVLLYGIFCLNSVHR